MPSETLITVRDVAQRLGISEDTVYRLKNKPGGLRAYKVGGSIRFKPSEVDAYIASQAVKPAVKEDRLSSMRRFKYVPGMKVV